MERLAKTLEQGLSKPMRNFIFFSKTLWSEPPRMRHQLAQLLLDSGESVIFVEKPLYPFIKNSSDIKQIEAGPKILQSNQLIHHQLRIFNFLRILNDEFEKISIKKNILPHASPNSVIVNFNYDYGFIRDIFPKNKIITVINDDFVSMARIGNGGCIKKALAKTCGISDVVLTVSYPLMQQLERWCKPILFLPWSESDYKPPSVSEKRDSILIWASINNVVDFNIVTELAVNLPDLLFYLVGPISGSANKKVPEICKDHKNIFYLPPSRLEDLNLNQFFASLMPYRQGVGSTTAVTLANKSVRLMSFGLPLIVHGMPNFLEHEAIYKCQNLTQIINAINSSKNRFCELQDAIQSFVSDNTAINRLAMFRTIIK